VARVFVSYRHADSAMAEWLKRELEPRWTVLTHAASPERATTWQDECLRLIGDADAMICVVGDTTAASPNVDWEIATALARGTPVLPLRADGSVGPALPRPLTGQALLEPQELAARLDEVALERAR
jgi:hypothetical protein